MGLNQFTIKQARALPVFILVDASGSMKGTKIDTVNNALREMIKVFCDLEGTKGQIEISIIKISNKVEIIQPLTKVRDIILPEITATGKTPIGAAIDEVNTLINDKNVVPVRSYLPMIILISDGKPTDITYQMYEQQSVSIDSYLAWEPISRLHNDEYGKRCMKLALGIGQDADFNMLKAFINNDSVPVIQAKNIDTIGKFFEWVTRTVTVRSLSIDPNQFEGIPFDDIFEVDELVR